MKFDAKVEELDNVIGYIESKMEESGAPMKAVMQVTVAAEEMFVNIAHYAYGSDEAEGYALVEVEQPEENTVSIRFVDEGVMFNPLKKADPDVTRSAEDRNIGGLGIYMVKKTMDSVDYVREDGKNIFTMCKKW